MSCLILVVNHRKASPTLHVNPTLFVIPCNVYEGIVDLKCQEIIVTYRLIFHSKIQSSVTVFHHKLLTRESRVLANG